MTLLSNAKIKEYLGSAIVIEPFHEELLNNCSYDLTLGTHAAIYKDPKDIEGVPTRREMLEAIKDARKDGEFDLRRMGYWLPAEDDPAERYKIVNFAEAGYLAIGPRQRYLMHSQEFAGGRVAGDVAVTTSLQATSTAGRLGLTVCMCAGWGDVGFINRWTFEVENHSLYPIVMPVGARIAQLCFHEVEVPLSGTDYQKTGQYQQGDMKWEPKDMIPKRMKVWPS
jgi:dCTP deaminase